MRCTVLDLDESDVARRLATFLARSDRAEPGVVLHGLVSQGLDRVGLPGAGNTLQRWQALAQVAAHDLALAKFYEGHTDALAILEELKGPSCSPQALWGVWCAESAQSRLRLTLLNGSDCSARNQPLTVSGTKSWCSGAHALTHALVSAWDDHDRPCLAAVPLQQPGVDITASGWCAVGMERTASVDVRFTEAKGVLIGSAGAYTARPGFWHGAAGIAACWYGALTSIAAYVLNASASGNPHRLVHLGAIDVRLAQCAALLQQTARQIDANPLGSSRAPALRARLAVEAAAEEVMRRASRALGAGPLCRDPFFAQMMADLPVFLRQSHAENDEQALGLWLTQDQGSPWLL